MATCKWCEAENADGALTCASCGQSMVADEGAGTSDVPAFSETPAEMTGQQIAGEPERPGAPVPPEVVSAPPQVVPVPVAPIPAAPPPPQAPQYAPPPPPQAPQYAPPPQAPQYAPPPQAPQYAPPPPQAPQYAPQGYPQQYAQPGYSQPQYAPPPVQPPKSGMANAILTTIFCCWPAGIVAIVFAAQVNSKWAAGDYAGAQNAAKKSNLWATIAAVLGIIVLIVSFIAQFAASSSSSYSY